MGGEAAPSYLLYSIASVVDVYLLFCQLLLGKTNVKLKEQIVVLWFLIRGMLQRTEG